MATDPNTTLTLTPKERARFESYVDRTTPGQGPPTESYAGGACCEWRGFRDKKDYGHFRLRGKMEKAHRVAYLIAHGHWPMPCGLHEVCDNPPCCEAAHISEGTVAENITQRVARGRSARGDTHGRHTHPERTARGDANGSRTHPERVPRIRGEASGAAKYSDETIKAVRAAAGTQREIAARFGMSQTHVGNIKRGEQRSPL
jgi:hypothetical protein